MQNDEGNHLAGGRCPSCQLALKPIYLSPHRRLHRPTDDFRRPCLGLGGHSLHDMQPGFGWNDPAATAFDHDPEGQIAARAAAIQDMENSLSQEYEDTRARYVGTSQWLKAPNGRPSNLNERQWVIVRTPRFKAWFGDWDAVVRQSGTQKIIARAISDKEWQQRVAIAHGHDADPSGKLSEVFGFAVIKQYITPDDIRKTWKTRGGQETNRKQSPLQQDDFVKAVEVLRDPASYKIITTNNGKPSAEFAREFEDGTPVLVNVQTAEEVAVSLKSIWKRLPGRNHAGGVAHPIRTSDNTAGVESSIHSDSQLVKPGMVSKIVDENGEPLVVYHGSNTPADFLGRVQTKSCRKLQRANTKRNGSFRVEFGWRRHEAGH